MSGDDPRERLRELVEQARGRCHSCVHQRTFDLPTGTIHYCRAFGVEMTQSERDAIRDCPRWQPFQPGIKHTGGKALQNPLLQEQIDAEDRLFWRLKEYLDQAGLDLKTLLVIAHESLATVDGLGWVDSLDDRFGDGDPGDLSEILSTLRELGYTSLCEIVERVFKP